MYIALGIIVPFIGTTLGAACVLFLKNDLKPKLEIFLNGFASGVMIAASIWSLLLPAIDMAADLNHFAFIPAVVGLTIGILFLLVLEELSKKIECKWIQKENEFSHKNVMLFLAVTLHNIPEGMAVGVVFAGVLAGNENITLVGAYSLAIGIAIQNIPEGAILSLPMRSECKSKRKAFAYGTLSGVVEPIASILTILLTKYIEVLLPYLLSFAAGAMIYVVVEELLPESCPKKQMHLGTIAFAVGFMIMMTLDVALG